MVNEIIDYLFKIEDTNNFDNEIKKVVITEISEINTYLSIPFIGSRNEKLKQLEWYQLWKERLISRISLYKNVEKKESYIENEKEFNECIKIKPLNKYPNLNIIYDSILVDEELKNVHIPAYDNIQMFNSLGIGEDINDQIEHYDSAVNLLSLFDFEYQIVMKSTSSVAIINTEPILEKGKLISLSGLNTLGLVFISKASKLLSAESLLHESLHNRLHALSLIFKFITVKDVIIEKTPLREDPRPLYGLFHQTYVLYFLNIFYKHILQSKIDNLAKKQESIIKRSHQQQSDFEMALKSLELNSEYLSKEGLLILNHMIRYR